MSELGRKTFRKIGRTIRRIRRLIQSSKLRLSTRDTQKTMKFL